MDRKLLALQPRLHLLARLVPEGCRLTDVGTDHGYLPVALLQQGRITAAIASDIGAEPREHARRTALQYGMDFRLCAGLSGVAPEETDVIVIAGMGGETIISILQDAPWTADGQHRLLLQPMTKAAALRHWLADNGYTFTGEHLVEDKGRIPDPLRGGRRIPPLDGSGGAVRRAAGGRSAVCRVFDGAYHQAAPVGGGTPPQQRSRWRQTGGTGGESGRRMRGTEV